MSLLPSGAIETGGYDINNSLRFRSSASAYLNRTPSSAGSTTIGTFSTWLKLGAISTDRMMYHVAGTSGNNNRFYISFNADNTFQIVGYNSSASIVLNLNTTQVLRDPSAWYHIVVAIDTTQATSSNRAKLYINGNQVTAFSTATYPSQNQALGFTNNTSTLIGANQGPSNYFDGYMTEFNFVTGLALTPSSFGETDAVTGVWKAKKYTGTYGTNGFYLPFKNNTTSTHAGTFNGSTQSLSVASNAVFGYGTSDFTMEGWFYFNNLNTMSVMSNLTTSSSVAPHIYYDSSSGLSYYTASAIRINGGALQANNWYHIAVSRSGTSTKMFVNGIQVGSTYTDTNNYGTSNPFIIADYAVPVSGSAQFNGNISNVRVVKGTALYTSNFVPSSVSLTAITNTSILTLQSATIVDNSGNSLTITNNGTVTTSTATPFVANIFGDNSGNNNNWRGNNINYSVSGTTYDAMTDSPTNTSATVANYCVLNPLNKGTGTLTVTDGNLQSAITTFTVFGSMAVSSGKWYWEVTIGTNGAYLTPGIAALTVQNNVYLYNQNPAVSYYGFDGSKYVNGTNSSYGATFTNGDVIGIAFDADNNQITFYKNNTSQGTITGLTSGQTWTPAISTGDNSASRSSSVNFGQRPFAYTPPTGFNRLNTFNLPTSTIVKGSSYMDAYIYTGDGNSTRTITFPIVADFVWSKNRTTANDHVLIDTVRGGTSPVRALFSNATTAEITTTAGWGGFGYPDSLSGTSYAVVKGTQATSYTNKLNDSYVNWLWQAGQGSTSSNTSGSITSTTSVSTTAGFSVVTYTGNGSSSGTFGHGLGVAPAMFIIKSRSQTGENWVTWHKSFSNTAQGNMSLNTTGAVSNSASVWGNTAPTSTLITVGNSAVNNNTSTYVAYCWAEIAGFSRFGSYTGNGSTDGTFVYTGFRPKFLKLLML
jgi:hypothetical protein